MALQCQSLQVHAEIACGLNKPLIIHSVKTHAEVLATLRPLRGKLTGVVHGFSGSYEIAQEYIRLGLAIGVGGTITYKRAQKTRDAVSRLPMDALLLETDSPDMPLAGKQGQPNLPIFLPEVATRLAELRGESIDEIARATTANSRRLFQV